MTSGEQRAGRVRELFDAALEQEGPERERLLGAVEDASLREEVESLLAHHAEARTPGRLPAGPGPDERLRRGASLGRYVVLHEVGAGGMGVVYAAYDVELERKVALKLLSESLDAAEGRARLVREARAMARIQHPNVVSVYEVVAQDGSVFVAMELVEGLTLRHWLRERPRSWSQVLECFLAAGRGLAAAHAAGLVHRDFKPGNVLLGGDGRVRVTDFGLARRVSAPAPDAEAPRAAAAPGPPVLEGAARLQERVTRTGHMVGTPRYMAPELYVGRPPDARSDQFSFCTALHEALHGEPPFEPAWLAEEARRLERGEGPVPALALPWRSRVPWWVRRAVGRGLSLKPEERFPDMDVLLEALSRPPAVWRRARAAAAVALAVGGLVLGGHGLIRWQANVCGGAERQLAGIWDANVRQRIQAAFAASGRPYATTAWKSVHAALEDYSREWVAMHTEACEATRLRSEQTEAQLALRMTCLERRHKALGRITHALAEADGPRVERAPDLVARLPGLKDCADLEALSARLEPPSAPGPRAEFDRIGARVEQSRAEDLAGRYAAALELARSSVEAARALGHPGLLAEALLQQGGMYYYTGDLEAAVQSYAEAWRGADVARDDLLRASAGSVLTYVVGYRQGLFAEALRWAELTQAVLERMGGHDEEQTRLLLNLGAVLSGAGRKPEARSTYERALALTDGDPRAHANFRWQLLVNLAVNCWRQDTARAIRLMEEAQALVERRFGPGHPNLGGVWLNLSEFLTAGERYPEALEYAHKALALLEPTHGPEHFMVGHAAHSLSAVLVRMGRPAEALPQARRSLAVLEKSLGPRHRDVALPLSQLGLIHLELGQPEQAVLLLERALDLKHEDEQVRGQVRFTLARALRALGREAGRRQALASEALAIFRAAGLRRDTSAVEDWLARSGR